MNMAELLRAGGYPVARIPAMEPWAESFIETYMKPLGELRPLPAPVFGQGMTDPDEKQRMAIITHAFQTLTKGVGDRLQIDWAMRDLWDRHIIRADRAVRQASAWTGFSSSIASGLGGLGGLPGLPALPAAPAAPAPAPAPLGALPAAP
jgi:hypothetical protein